MTTAQQDKPSITVTQKTKRDIESRFVYLKNGKNKSGVVPLEERVGGKKNVGESNYVEGKLVNSTPPRPIRFGETGYEQYDPSDPDDAAFLERLIPWLDSGDPRIEQYGGMQLVEGDEPDLAPIELYEHLKPEAIINRISENVDALGDDGLAREFLEKCAAYEMRRRYPDDHEKAGKLRPPRKKILEAIDDIGAMSGVEYGDDEVTVE